MTKAEFGADAYDAIIIGTGQAGPALARRLAAAGMTVAIVERALFGGTCVNTGCIPTKTLIASAYAIHMARRAADFGVLVEGPVRADMARVKARKDAISGQSRAGLEESLKTLENCTVYRGHARFVSPHEVQIGEALLTAERIFINVGGRASGSSRRISQEPISTTRHFAAKAPVYLGKFEPDIAASDDHQNHRAVGQIRDLIEAGPTWHYSAEPV